MRHVVEEHMRQASTNTRARDSVRACQRADFLPRTVWQPSGPFFRRLDRDGPAHRTWLRIANSASALVTEFDDEPAVERDGPGRIPTVCVPPATVMMSIAEQLVAIPGLGRVLQVGAASGYPAAFLGHALRGRSAVTCAEPRSDLARRAAERLDEHGTGEGDVRLEHADFLGGEPCGERPWDAIVAGLALTGHMPGPLIRCARPGAVLLVPYASDYAPDLQVLVRFVVGLDRDRAEGRIVEHLPRHAFAQDTHRLLPLPAPGPLPRDADRVTDTGLLPGGFLARTTGFPSAQFVIGLRVPHCRMTESWDRDHRLIRWTDLTPGATEPSFTELKLAHGARRGLVYEVGPRRLWEEITRAHQWWLNLGKPPPSRFVITAYAQGEIRYALDTPMTAAAPGPPP
ncbi:hypothetical protein ACIP5N_21205 [Streptomyces sp. NPDC088768]|uniref:hypothetical protein n=1 Tax=Streptomyces sp. NPDC088768 TaxID=3365894 RepID=UPI003805AA72